MTNPPQLFDDPTASEQPRPKHWKREGENATPSPIGSGPPGETCKTCIHDTKLDYHGKTYHKCGLMQKHWTHGGASDIKLRWAACSHWNAKHFFDRVLALGEYAEQCIAGRGWFREPLLVIAEYYEESGQDMGWLRHAAAKFQPMPSEKG
jgi:hypothetical protein